MAKEFDNTPWEPSPIQYALTGWAFAWVTAVVIEKFLLGDGSLIEVLTTFGGKVVNGDFDSDLIAFLLLWWIVPVAAMAVPIRINRKWKSPVLLLGSILLVVLLVVTEVRV